jgi:streptogramin lyase
MTNRMFFGTTWNKAAACVLLCGVCGLVTGCTTTQFIGPDNSPVAGAALSGVVHGGQNPITGASIQMWTVGTSGYGSAASGLGPTLTTDPVNGTFTYTAHSYTCPTSSSQVYITSQGGNPGLGSGVNNNIMLVAALGSCGNLSSSTNIVINEVSTAAAAFALGQYFTTTFGSGSTDSFGSPVTAEPFLANAMLTAGNLVTLSTGYPVTSTTLTGAGGSVTVTPESTKLLSIANILATCVNSAGGTSGCGTLFADVTPTGGTAPTDTLQAAVYMSLNPTSANATAYPANLQALCGLVTATPVFSSTGGCPGTTPTDWTLGILYTNSTALNDPQNIAADASGNIWVLNHNGTTSASLTELSGGTPASSIQPGTPLVNASTIAGFDFHALQPRNEAIDTAGNVWFVTSSSPAQVIEYVPGGTSVDLVDPTNKGAYGITIDGNNNVFYTHESGSSTYSVMELLGGNTSSVVEYPVYSPGATNQQPEFAALDTSGVLWMTNGSSTSGLEQNIFQMSAYNGAVTGVCTVFPCNVSTTGDTTLTQVYTDVVSATGSVPTLSEPSGIAAGALASVWTANYTGNTVTQMTSATTGTNYGSATSVNKPDYVAVDGVGNVWVTNNGTTSVSEFGSSGSVLSPVNTGTAPFTAVGFLHGGLSAPAGVAVDPSGNVWFAGNNSSTPGVMEIVGAGAPTVTPISLALKNAKVASKP